MQLIPAKPLSIIETKKAQSMGFRFRGQYVSHAAKGKFSTSQSAMAGYLRRMGYLL